MAKRAKQCRVVGYKLSKNSALGEFLGVKMHGYRCAPHGQGWTSSIATVPQLCSVGRTLRCPYQDRSLQMGCRICGSSHRVTRELYGELAPEAK